MLAQWLRKNAGRIPANRLRRLTNLWPPFLGAGIKLAEVSEDYRQICIEMNLRWYNKNYVGTHFGGSLYAMTDPFYMMMLINNLGEDYIVWDKAAAINFIKPGRGKVSAHFHFSAEELSAIKHQADSNEKYIFDKVVNIIDQNGEIVASVNKTLYVRKKKP
jgi:acyl-coenzyme A thioesterase PaaI-like protein